MTQKWEWYENSQPAAAAAHHRPCALLAAVMPKGVQAGTHTDISDCCKAISAKIILSSESVSARTGPLSFCTKCVCDLVVIAIPVESVLHMPVVEKV